MNTDFNHLKNLWQESKNVPLSPSSDVDSLIKLAQKKMKITVQIQWGTIVILAITLVIIGAFFNYVAQFKQTLSHVGAALMAGGLMVRILLELVSIYLSRKINLTESTLKSNDATISYFRFRKIMNGPVTIMIVLLYSVGFYMLTPEFSLYFTIPMMVLINASYILAAVIFTWSIRIAVKKEMTILKEIIGIQEDITKGL